jgi:sec-independent protein translocase protein TatC
MTRGKDDLEDSSAPLIEHLAELRTRLINAVMAFIVGMVLAFMVAEPILQFLLGPIEATLRALGDPSPTMQYTSPQEYLFTLFRISMVFGFALAFPVISYQLWRFVAPGLYRSEKGAFLPFLIASPFMFMLGASFAHFVVTPLAMAFFLGFADVSSIFANLLSRAGEATGAAVPDGAAIVPTTNEGIKITFFGKVNESLDITLKFILAFGMCFQLPVLLTLMGKAGLVSAEGLGAVRKYAIVGILILAAIVTPPDVTTQLILFVVVYGLYEISIWLVRMVERKREAKLRAEGYYDDEDEADAPAAPAAAKATDPEEEFDDPLIREFDEDLAKEAAEKDGKA